MKILILTSVFFIVANQLFAQLVNTQYGSVSGNTNGNVYEFLGIPYAKPPVGNLRWKPTEAPDPWLIVWDATQFRPECPQKKFSVTDTAGVITGDEDCLYLNVWSPELGNANKPVMVFIHGGGNQQGSANEPIYFGKNLAERGDVVVVTIQYRLGALGFLVHPGLDSASSSGKSGNFGVYDQIMALQWVKNNIAPFGGNPNNVTIFGQSAGGMSVSNLLFTHLSTGLFHKAIVQSAAPSIKEYSASMAHGIQFVNQYSGATGTPAQQIAYLKSLPVDSLVFYDTSPIVGGNLQGKWGATLDSIIFFQQPVLAILSGNFHKVPFLIGANSEEMSRNAPQVVTPAMHTAFINMNIPQQHQATALQLYPPGTTNAEARASYVELVSDNQFVVNTRRTARCISQNQTEPVWYYHFTQRHSVSQLQPFGAYHGMELFFVFNTWENMPLGTGILFKPSDDSTQKIMLQYWTNFAKTGNPNGGNLPTWQQFTSSECYMELKATPNGNQCNLKAQKLDFWDQVVNFTFCQPTTSLQNIDYQKDIVVFPNPVSEVITFKTEELIRYEIYGVEGKLYQHGLSKSQVNVQDLPPGTYLLKIFSNEKGFFKKFVKVK